MDRDRCRRRRDYGAATHAVRGGSAACDSGHRADAVTVCGQSKFLGVKPIGGIGGTPVAIANAGGRHRSVIGGRRRWT